MVVVTIDPLFRKGLRILSHFFKWDVMRLDGMVVVTVDPLFRKGLRIFNHF